jgi:hypothetical protein
LKAQLFPLQEREEAIRTELRDYLLGSVANSRAPLRTWALPFWKLSSTSMRIESYSNEKEPAKPWGLKLTRLYWDLSRKSSAQPYEP